MILWFFLELFRNEHVFDFSTFTCFPPESFSMGFFFFLRRRSPIWRPVLPPLLFLLLIPPFPCFFFFLLGPHSEHAASRCPWFCIPDQTPSFSGPVPCDFRFAARSPFRSSVPGFHRICKLFFICQRLLLERPPLLFFFESVPLEVIVPSVFPASLSFPIPFVRAGRPFSWADTWPDTLPPFSFLGPVLCPVFFLVLLKRVAEIVSRLPFLFLLVLVEKRGFFFRFNFF